jgi:hypothetical protein
LETDLKTLNGKSNDVDRHETLERELQETKSELRFQRFQRKPKDGIAEVPEKMQATSTSIKP